MVLPSKGQRLSSDVGWQCDIVCKQYMRNIANRKMHSIQECSR